MLEAEEKKGIISLEIDSPSRGRKRRIKHFFFNGHTSLEIDSPSRGRKRMLHENNVFTINRLDIDSPSSGRILLFLMKILRDPL